MIQHPLTYIWKELRIAVGVGFTLFVILLVSFRLAVPFIADALPGLKYWVEYQIKSPVRIDKLEIIWRGSRPAIRLSEVAFLDSSRTQAILQVDQVDIVINPLDSLINGKFEMDTVWVDHARIRIQQTDKGTLRVMDIFDNINTPIVAQDEAWISVVKKLPIRRIVIQNSDLHLIDPKGQSWPFTALEASIHRDGSTVNFRANGTLLGVNDAYFEAKSDIHNIFEEPTGQVYFSARGFELSRFQEFFPKSGVTKVTKGSLGLEVWSALEMGRLKNVAATFDSYDVHFARPEDGDIDFFPHISGNLLWRNIDDYHWLTIGHDFQVTHEDEIWRSSAVQLDYAMEGEVPHYTLKAQDVQLDMWVPFLVRSEWLPAELLYLLDEYHPGGMLRYVSAGIEPRMNAPPWYSIQMAGDNLSLIQPDIGYNFTGLNVRLSLDDTSGMMQFYAPILDYYPVVDPTLALTLDRFKGAVHWYHADDGWVVQGIDHEAKVDEGSILVDYRADFDLQGKLKNVAWLLDAHSLPVKDLLGHWPLAVENFKLRSWFDQALVEGHIDKLSWLYRGNGSTLKSPLAAHQLHATLNNIDLNYADPWPALTKLNGSVQLTGTSLDVRVDQATIGTDVLAKVSALMPDVSSSEPMISIDSHLMGPLESVADTLEATVLDASVGRSLTHLNPRGPFDLGLVLKIPLTDPKQLSARGILNLSDISLKIGETKPIELEHIQGEIQFSDKHMAARNMSGWWLGYPFATDVDATFLSNDARVQVLTHTRLPVPDVLGFAGVDGLPVAGDTDFNVEVLIPLGSENSGGRITVSTDLLGINVELPEPFFKDKDEIKPFKLQLHLEDTNALGLTASYGPEITYAQRVQEEDQQWQMMGAHLHIGEQERAQFHQDRIFLIDGHLERISAEEWLNAMAHVTLQKSGEGTTVLEPHVNLYAKDWLFWDWPFTDTTLKAQPRDGQWWMQAKGPQIEGEVTFEKNIYDRPIALNLARFVLPERVPKFVAEPAPPVAVGLSVEGAEPIVSALPEPRIAVSKPVAQSRYLSMKLPALVMQCDYCQWRGIVINNLELDMTPRDQGYQIQTLKAQGKDIGFDLTGYWGYSDQREPVNLAGWIQTNNLGHLLKNAGQPSALQDTNAHLELSLAWMEGFISPNYETLAGYVSFKLKNGQILGIDPGLGRILGLLSLSNIQKRLTLNFSDLTKNGFPFDRFSGRFDFDKGWATILDLMIRGPIANIDFSGKIGLAAVQDIQGEMLLSPNIAGSLPLAVTIASGNPAIGAAVWLFNKTLGAELEEIIRYRYAITGTLEQPHIEELEIIREKPGRKRK